MSGPVHDTYRAQRVEQISGDKGPSLGMSNSVFIISGSARTYIMFLCV